MEITFGPVPSRRLGRSLGINNIPPKICSYACVYCQLGRTPHMQIERQTFYSPDELTNSVREQVERRRADGEQIDYLTFVPDGEPTLDLHLGEEIAALKPLGIPIAVISNASLIWRQDVRDELMGADWVSLKVDAASPDVWRRINRPHGGLQLPQILDGISAFASEFTGEFVTETMLVADGNDGPEAIEALAAALSRLQPAVSYLAIPTRPPAEDGVHPPSEARLNAAYHRLQAEVPRVELLLGYEGNAFASSGDAKRDLLSITAVHPMRREAVEALLRKDNAGWALVEGLLEDGRLVQLQFEGNDFYLRSIERRPPTG